jgi:hypothetical protein
MCVRNSLCVDTESHISCAGGDSRPFGDRNGNYLLCLISLLLLIREVFLTATIANPAKQNDERLWFPLVALPELLAVVCYSVSGLVPPRSTLNKDNTQENFGSAQPRFETQVNS